MRRLLVPVLLIAVGAVVAGGCGPASEPPDPPARPSRPPVTIVRPDTATPPPQTDTFDARPIEFDTVEVPPAVVPPPPDPATAPPPDPPVSDGPAGSCDVRASEAFCFAYEGEGWTPRSARAHCDRAPGARFDGGACSTDARIGTCRFDRPDAPGQTLVYTYYAPYPVDLARLACPGDFEAAQ